MEGYAVLGGAFLLGLSLVGGAWRALRILGSIQKLIDAQLTTNGGGSLVDKVNRIPALQQTVATNHEEALAHWKTLEMQAEDTSKAIGEIKRELGRGNERFEGIEHRLERGGL